MYDSKQKDFSRVYALYASITADASSTAVTVPVPFKCEVIDVVVQARATSSSGTATVRTGTTAISDAIVMATDTNIVRAGTLDDAYTTLSEGASLNVITHGSTDRGLVTIFVRQV